MIADPVGWIGSQRSAAHARWKIKTNTKTKTPRRASYKPSLAFPFSPNSLHAPPLGFWIQCSYRTGLAASWTLRASPASLGKRDLYADYTYICTEHLPFPPSDRFRLRQRVTLLYTSGSEWGFGCKKSQVREGASSKTTPPAAAPRLPTRGKKNKLSRNYLRFSRTIPVRRSTTPTQCDEEFDRTAMQGSQECGLRPG